ncbi:hypothetical protein AAEH85_21780, partial [Shewanella algae]|uniref:hypothetical protein n=1 Tax=Shewanella algae TaxID=38313 RepID=UPI00313BB01D
KGGYNNISGSGNVFLGFGAGINELGSNKLYIDNAGRTTPIIYGDFTNKHVTINDSLTSKYFQMSNGASNGYILKSDASGNASWVSPST